ncbi:MAG: Ig-like domain repeat protein [Nitrospirae bacterium]|nr:Ig-like domain repeat protein [Nitrospirota bacterium]
MNRMSAFFITLVLSAVMLFVSAQSVCAVTQVGSTAVDNSNQQPTDHAATLLPDSLITGSRNPVVSLMSLAANTNSANSHITTGNSQPATTGSRGAFKPKPELSTTATEFKVFNNIGSYTDYIQDGGAWLGYFIRNALLEDSGGNLYFVYGNAKQLWYAEYTANINSWSNTQIDTRSKGVAATSMVLDTNGNRWVFTSEITRVGNWDRYGDSAIYEETGGSWNKAADLYVNRGWELTGPNDVAHTMIKDANNNLHVLFQREGWFSYGNAAKEMIYDATAKSLSGIITISGTSSGGADDNRNDANDTIVLSSDGTIYAPMTDHQQGFFYIGKSSTYGSWDTSTVLGYTGDYQSGVSYQDEFGNWHTVYTDSTIKNVYYGLNWATPQEIYTSTGNIGYYPTDIIAVGNIVYISAIQYDSNANARGDYYLIVKDANGTWSAPQQITSEASWSSNQVPWADGFVKKAHASTLIPSVYFAYLNQDGSCNNCTNGTSGGWSGAKLKILQITNSTKITNSPTATSTSVSSSENPSNYGDSVTFTATVTGASPTGTVTFKDGVGTIAAVSLDVNGHASFPTSSLSGGTHSITAVYGGDSSNATSTSSVLSQVVTVLSQVATTYTISGTVTLSGSGLSGVTVILSGAGTATTTTNGSGAYSFTGLSDGSYTVTPGMIGYRFSPPLSIVTVSGADSTGNDFTASVNVPTPGGFSATGNLNKQRGYHTSTLLPNGQTLIVGGSGSTQTAELYDPSSGTFTATTGSPTQQRDYHTATLLPNGKVLIVGSGTSVGAAQTAELYDQSTGTFTATTGSPTQQRSYHTATLLPNGLVLIVGGASSTQTAELYDPSTGTFTATTGSPTQQRVVHTATLLPNGLVLIVGGNSSQQTAELYNPSSGLFTATTGNPAQQRYSHTATLLPNGLVLIVGGSPSAQTAELYDPSSETFAATVGTPAQSRNIGFTATLLPSGKVLIAGGQASPSTAELYDPTAGTFAATTGSLIQQRYLHTATLLAGGKVLIAGGVSSLQSLETAELFDPSAGTFTGTNAIPTTGRYWHTATLLPSGKVLIAGGGYSTETAELFDPTAGTFTATGSPAQVRYWQTATLLPNGKALIVGSDDSSASQTAELYDPSAGTFTATGIPTQPRESHTATLLPNGKVLIAGGQLSLQTAELYDPTAGTFTATGNLTVQREYHTATLLPNGKVLIVGGQLSAQTAELFDPTAGTFTATGIPTVQRDWGFTATLLPNGKVLIVGGVASPSTAELYDPTAGTFTATGIPTQQRYHHSSALLPNGLVLIVGGVGGSSLQTAELYDPSTGTFTATGIPTQQREYHTATMLPNGQALIVGGWTSPQTAELFDPFDGLITGSRRPNVSSMSFTGTKITLSGTKFKGDSEASGGSFNNSSTNYPILQLMRIDNGQTYYVPSDSTTNWSDTTFQSASVASYPGGHYIASIITNALQSTFTGGVTGAIMLDPTSTLSCATSGSPSLSGNSVSFTATLLVSNSPIGGVTFTDNIDGTLCTSVGLIGVTATCSKSTLSVGSHTITATFSGDSLNEPSSCTVNQVVSSQTSTSTAVVSSLNPSTDGAPVTFTATVTGSSPTGNVTFYDGATSLGTVALNGSWQAAYSTSSLSVTTHSITAVYAGDSNNTTSTSSVLSQVVNAASSTTTLTSSLNPSTYGASVTFTATVAGVSPTGNVTFKDGTTTLTTVALSGGQATYSTYSLTNGTHSITALYDGDPNNTSSTSSALSQVVNTAPAYAGSIYVANLNSNTVTVYPNGSSTSTPSYTISGLNEPRGVAADANYTYIANSSGNTVAVYPKGASTSTPSYTISGLNYPFGVAVDANYIYVINYSTNSATVYPKGASTSTPSYTISGLTSPQGVAVDANYIYVANVGVNTVAVYPKGASTSTPSYTISGLNYPFGVAVDANYIYVANVGVNTVTVYPKGASTSTPSYTISGLSTPCGVAVDANYIYVINYSTNSATVYPKGASTSTPSYTISGLTSPQGVAVDSTAITPTTVANAYVTNATDGTVSVINTSMNTVIAAINVGTWPGGVAVTPNGAKVYVANQNSNNVSVINTATNAVTATINVGSQPSGVAVTPDGLKVYVANYASNNVSVINTSTNSVTATITVGTNPYGIAVTPDGTKVYVSNSNDGTVSVINTSNNAVTGPITVGTSPIGIIVTPDGSKAYVANAGAGSSTVSVINTSSDTVTGTITVGSQPYGVAVTPDGAKVYVTNYGSNNVSVIKTSNSFVSGPITVGSGPRGVAVTPNGQRVYVANWNGTVSAIDTTTNTVIDTIPAGNGPVALGNFIGTIPTINEYTIPTGGSNPHAITSGPDGNLWFTEFNGNKIGKITTSGVITEYAITTVGSQPVDITSGSDSNLWFAESNGNKIGNITTSGTVTEYGGLSGGSEPTFITSGVDGNLWFTEQANHTVGKITTGGVTTEYNVPNAGSLTFGITSGPDGNLWFAEYSANNIANINPTTHSITEYLIPTSTSHPYSITTGPDGNLWFTEENTNKIGTITTSGTITEYDIPTAASWPVFITTGPDGNLWFAEYHGNQIGKITNGGVITEYAIPTAGSQPVGITTGPDGNIWFTEYNANKIGVIVLSLSSTTTAVASSSNPSTSGSPVTFTATVTGTSPTGTVMFKDGATALGTAALASGQATYSTSSLSTGTHSITAVYSGDSNNATSTSPVLSQVVNSDTSTTTIASSLNPSTYGNSVFFKATVTGSSPTGNVTFYDGATSLGTVALSSGQAAYSTLSLSVGTHTITAVYAGDANNATSTSSILSQIVHPAAGAIISTVAGNGTYGYSGDGGLATSAKLNNPDGVALDSAGNLYIADNGNSRIRIVAAASGTYFGQAMTAGDIYTVAGNGTQGYSGDGGLATSAKLNNPDGVALDSAGNLYIADNGNSRIRIVAAASGTYFGQAMTAGDIYTVAGNGTQGYSGDGGLATSAKLNNPDGVALDSAGNLYIADNGNSRIRIVAAASGTYFGQAMTAGDIYTVAGNGTQGYSGDGGLATSAKLNNPDGVALDSAGNLYIADNGNSRIRIVAAASGTYFGQAMTAGDIYTVAGNGTQGYSGDGGLATSAELYTPVGVALDSVGNLYIADEGNNRIREVQMLTTSSTTVALTTGINPSTYGSSLTFTVAVTGSSPTDTVTLYDGATSLGSASLSSGQATFTTSSLSVGTHSITAVYSGDANNATSTSSVLSQVVNAATYTISGTITLNGSGLSGVTVTLSWVGGAASITGLSSAAGSETATTNGSGAYSFTGLPNGSYTVTPGLSGYTFTPTSASVTLNGADSSANNFIASVPTYSISGQMWLEGDVTGITVTLTGDATAETTTDINGRYSFTGLTNGNYTVTPSRNGYSFSSFADGNSYISVTLNGADSTGNDFTISLNSTTAISSSLNPSTYGVLVTFTATVTGTSPTGTVTFKDGSTTLGTASLVSGQAAFSTYSLSAGTHSITAVYAGDQSNPASTSSVLSQVVNSATTLTVSLNPSTSGTPVTFTATVIGTSPTGSVTFMDGATALGIVSLVSGQATFTTSSLSVATHSITAIYSGDGNNLTSTSAVLSQVVTSATAQSAWVWTANKVNPAANNNWAAIASNSNGTRLIAAVYGGDVWTSSDSGATWTASNVNGGFNNWQSVASNSDGTRLIAAVNGGDIWTSSNGVWAENNVSCGGMSKPVLSNSHGTNQGGNCNDSWTSVASNSDGSKLVAAIYGGDIWTSSNGVWTANNVNGGYNNWQSVASDSTGTKLVAVVYGGDIWTSSNGTWTANNVNGGSNNWSGVASNSDGTKLIAFVNNGDIWTSLNSVWTARNVNPVGLHPWASVASNSSGTNLAAAMYEGGDIWTSLAGDWTDSLNSGANWWDSVASNSDGTKLIAAIGSTSGYETGDIWTSSNSGYSWTANNVNGGNNMWQSVASDSTGTKLAAAMYGGDIWTYSSGVWAVNNVNGGQNNWYSLASNSDGTKLIAAVRGGDIWTSSNGVWTANNVNGGNNWWYSVASNADGTKLIAAVGGGDIWTYSNGVWTANNVNGGSNNWYAVASNSDGTVLVAAANGGDIWTYSNSAWTANNVNGGSNYWQSVASNSTGSKLVAAVYNGDIWTGVLPATTTTVSSSLNPSTYGAGVTFTATVTASGVSPSGTVTFMDNRTTIGSASLSVNGQASFTPSPLSMGTHLITAVYGGNPDYSASTSAVLNQVVNSAATTTTVSSSANPSTYGTSVTFTATVTGTSPTGTVTFTDSVAGVLCSSVPVSAGTCNTSSLSVGTHTITAAYSGDSNNAASSGTVSQIVNSPTTYAISGTVTLNGNGLSGVTVTLIGAGTATTTTNGSGAYSFTGLSNGTYTVSPGLTGYTFNPTSSGVTVSGANSTGNNFTATAIPTTHAISGKVTTDGSTGLSGVTVTLGGASSATTTTAVDGTYSFTGLSNGTYTVTPTLTGYTFNPQNYTGISVNGADVSGKDFITSNPVYTISGTIYGAADPTQVTVILTGTNGNAATTPASNGTFSFTARPAGNYIVTPILSGSAFNATSRFLVLSGNSTGNDFTASSAPTGGLTISGTVSLNSSVPDGVYVGISGLNGVLVTLTGASSALTYTARVNLVDGTYSFTNLPAGNYTVTPILTGYAFSAINLPLAISGNSTGNDFIVTAASTYTVTGTIRDNSSNPIVGVTVALTGTDNGTTATDSNGLYMITGVSNGTYTVTPTKTGYTFSQLSRSVTVSGADSTGNNFTAASATTTTVTSSLNPATYGTAVTFTATVTASGVSPSGTVTFVDNGTTVGSSPLSVNGQATFTSSSLSIGTHQITAAYGGSSNYSASTTSALSQVVRTATTTTTLTSSVNPSTLGDSVTFTATVAGTGSTPTGTVTFMDNGTTMGSASIANGQAAYTTSSLSPGTHPITAVYSGDNNSTASTSAVLNQAVAPVTATTVVASSLNPSTYGTSVIFTATISSTTSPTGTAVFMDNTTIVAALALDGNGQAAYTTSALSVGEHPITVVYSGDGNNLSSTSAALNQLVMSATATTITSSLNPSKYGAAVTFTATVTGTSPTGTVTFMDNTTTLGAISVNGKGQAVYSSSSLSVGVHPITAVYSGDAYNFSSTSAALSQAVGYGSATTITSSLNPSKYRAAVTFTATVTGTSPTGTVTFMDNTTTLSSVSLSASRKAVYSTSSLLAGTHPITAVYSGDNNSLSSKSETLNQLVTPATVTTLASSQNPLAYGTALTLTATVTGESPTGIVTFVDNTTMDNTTALSTLGAVTIDGRGKASLIVTSLAAGTHSIVAVYSGDANNLPSTSTVLSQIVTTIILTSSQNPANYGVAVTFTAAVMGNSPTGTITFMAGETPMSTVSFDVNGQASLTVVPLIGTYSITAVYSGDANNPASTSAALTQVVESITVTSSMSSSAYGVPVTFTATITGNSPTGTITFMDNTTTTPDNTTTIDNTTTLGTAALVNGEASLTTAALSIGTHSITAIYGGDLYNIASTSSPLTQTIIDNNTVQTVSFTVAGSGAVLVYDDNFNLISTQRQGSNTSMPYGTARIFYFQPTEGSVLTSLTLNGRPMRPVSIIRAIMTEDYIISAVYYP